ncbi:ras-related protein Rab-9B [Teleopsis dalmanni]|uniref:ras-related protein Rab-9B n=1 Tax=Teleopsis dalmanni TaxID=139649 RepID=UPI0018CE22E3|nr:ras-related protein Rab-9B [Teleopsis dalmanni]
MTNMRPPNKTILLKVVILGDGGVGKSCLMNRFVSNRYDENNFHTIGVEFMNKDIDVDGEKYTLQIWDTAGQERFRALRTPFYRGSDVCILCYAVNDRDSFRGLKLWRDEFLAYANIKADKFPFIVVGNKVDLALHDRQVSFEEVQEWCDNNSISSVIETSSKAASNVTDAFTLAVRQWKHMERVAEIELKQQNDTIDLTKTIRLAHNRLCCTGNAVGSGELEDESMSSSSPRRFGRRQQTSQQTNFQL